MKTIAAISDIHGNILALEAIVNDIAKRNVDIVVNLGDHLSGPLWPKETIRFLMRQHWTQISGNHDRHLCRQDPDAHGLSDRYAFTVLDDLEKEWLRQLPETVRLDEDTLLFHGTPSNDSDYLLETVEHGRAVLASRDEIRTRFGITQFPLMLCGHSHVQRIVEIDETIMIVNPGSVGLPAYEDNSPAPHVIESGSPHARYAILQHAESWTVELISVPYNFQRAADQARKNNRPDWAIALQTGTMK